MRRENRVAAAIITGAAGNGMGRSIALTLARQGESLSPSTTVKTARQPKKLYPI